MTADASLSKGRLDAAVLLASLGLDADVLDDICRVGSVVSDEVPQLVEDFYVWLVELPEFERFFEDKALLAHVKAQQIRYWEDFLAANIDDAYVAKRRSVGNTHANIGLGLLVYLRAMQFVSDWLVRRIHGEPGWSDRREAMASSIRKLIEFDSAIVVDTYAARSERLLADQRERLELVARVMHAVSEGDLSQGLEARGPQDLLGASVNGMVASLKAVAHQMGMIARGDYSVGVTPRSEKDELSRSLVLMTNALREAAELKQKQVWMAESLRELREAMTGNPNVAELCDRVLAYLCRKLEAQVGATYVLEGGSLVLAGTYAAKLGQGLPPRLKLGEGLLGQAGLERRRIVVNDVPEDALRVSWGLGEALPRSLVVLPLVHSDDLKGVTEVGSLWSFDQQKLEFLEAVTGSISQAISEAQARARVQELLEASQAQAEELEAQQEELRQANEELEEHTQLLERERETVEARNREIAKAQRELQTKANELAAASRYKSEFLASMSHELRTPLNSMLILSKLLAENSEETLTPQQVEYAHMVHTAGGELLQLINEVLDLSKIEAGRIELEVVELETAELAGYLERSFRPLAQQKGVAFSVSVDEGVPATLRTDVQRLQQVLKNLLSNAFKFTAEGAVQVMLRVPPGAGSGEGIGSAVAPEILAIEVRDSGIGIPDAKQQEIFEAFRQADAGTSRKYGGTGLGLSISRELARLLGGEITVASRPREGSTFTLYLLTSLAAVGAPRVAATSPTPHTVAVDVPPVAHDPVERGSGLEMPEPVLADDRNGLQAGDRVILIVEDDLKFAKVLLDVARQRGFKALVCADGTSGLALARRFTPDAVTLDIHLPDVSGWTVFDRLKRDPLTRHIPVHIISVDGGRRRGMTQGAVMHLDKPVDADELRAAFEQIRAHVQREVKHLLVVEDDPAERVAIAELVGNGDVATTAVGTGADAIAALSRCSYDCMVLDLGLPDMEGAELIRRIQENPAARDLPIIVYTGRDLTHAEELSLERAADAIIIKDVRSPERLLAETALFLHRVEAHLPEPQKKLLRQARAKDELLEGRRVLIVDDDVRNIFALSTVLERRGMQVSFAESGRAALELLQQEGDGISVILMDIMMPELDGYETIRAVRLLPGFEKVPIIAVTAKAMKGDRDKCLRAGASDYISKPVDTDQLLSLLRVWLYESPKQRRDGVKPNVRT